MKVKKIKSVALLSLACLILSGCDQSGESSSKKETFSTSETAEVVAQQMQTDQKFDKQKIEPFVQYMFHNQAFEKAWQDFVTLNQTVQLADRFNGGTGTKVAELDEKNLQSAGLDEGEFEEGLLRMYQYEGTATNPVTNTEETGQANLYALSQDNMINYLALSTSYYIFDQNHLLDQDIVASLVNEPFDFSELKQEEPIVTDMGLMIVNDHPYMVITMLSGQADNPVVEYFATSDGKLDYITSKSLAEVQDNSFAIAYQALKDYIGEYSGEFYKLQAPEASGATE